MSRPPRKTRTYRGSTYEDVLRQVREELGPDAVVLRRREGIVGGVGGFFGKRCVEVDARPPVQLPDSPSLPLPLPTRAVLDVYDTADGGATNADPWEPARPVPAERSEIDEAPTGALPVVAAFVPEPAPALATTETVPDDPPPEEPELLRELERQVAPFAAKLAEAVGRDAGEGAGAPEPALAEELVDAVALSTRDETEIVRENLLAAGIQLRTIEAILDEARLHRRPLAPEEPLALHARRALERRIRVRHGWRGRRRTIAVVGPTRSGRTLTAARLCHAYATAGRVSTAALSLESARRTLDLGALTKGLSVGLEIASSPDAVRDALERLDADVVVADTPAADPYDPPSVERVAALLEALAPDETHLLVPARLGVHEARILLDAIRPRVGVDRLLLTRLDELGDARAGVALSLESRLPISYLAVGATWGLRPAEPSELAELVLP